MRWAWLLGLLVLTAGCVGGAGGDDVTSRSTEEPGEDVATREVTREYVFEADVDRAATGDGRIEGVEWLAPFSENLVALELSMTWEESANAFGLDVEGATDRSIAPEQDPTSASLSASFDAEPGPYAFYPTREGPVANDTLQLAVTATFEIPEGEAASVEGCTEVQTRHTHEGWRATFTCEATGPVSEAKDATLDTTNGAIAVDGGADETRATVEVWAEADSEQAARERARSVHVTVRVTEAELVAKAEAPSWENRGADAYVGVQQARLDGEADTTNGPIELAAVETHGFRADTTNGPIVGGLTGSGDIRLDTTNGEIDVAFTPEADAEVAADTTNGPVRLSLAETDEIAYTIDASTTNGQITESMDQAHLEGSDDEATLVTDDGDDRPIQVTGVADATNGPIHFEPR